MPADPQRSTDEKCFCTHCGAELPSTPTDASGPVECPACELPNEFHSPVANTKPKRSEHAEVLKFFCTYCNQKLSALSVFAGKEFDCPNCSRSNTVPGESPLPPVARDLIKFFCTGCGQKLSVEKKRIGQTIECPLCSGATLVPKEGVPVPKTPAKLTRPADLPHKTPPRPTAAAPASSRPIPPKPALTLAPPTAAAKRPAAKPQLITNGSAPAKAAHGKARPASTNAARKTTPNGKQTAPPSPQKS